MAALPSRVVPAKKSTFVTGPSVSEAVALKAMLAGLVYIELLTGLVRPTVGGTLGGELTVTLTPAEVVIAPELSVAMAVRL